MRRSRLAETASLKGALNEANIAKFVHSGVFQRHHSSVSRSGHELWSLKWSLVARDSSMRSSALMEALTESSSQAPQHELYEFEGLLYLTALYF